jgi:predicted RNA-binding Zn-ribbon protein involved in translation (DUF1610 family)
MTCPNCGSENTALSKDKADEQWTYDCLDCGIWFLHTECLKSHA